MNSTEFEYLLDIVNKLQTNLRHAHQHNDDNEHDHIHDDDDDHHHHDHDDESSIIVAKSTAMVVLFCASTLCGCIPFLLNRWFKWTETNTNARSAIIVKCLLYFGGGVLLCTTFLHLLPEVNENIEELQADNVIKKLNFHLAELLMCIGFFAMYLVEEIIHMYINKQTKKDAEQMAFERGRSIRNSYLVRGGGTNNNNSSSRDGGAAITTTTTTTTDSNDIENQKKDFKKYDHHDDKQLKTIDQHINEQNYQHQQQHEHQHSQHHHSHHHHSHHHHSHHHHHHGHSHNVITENTIVSSLRGLLIVLALSLHELFEGLAVGLESETANVWYMFGAVSAHKLVLAFCVGVELIVTRTRLWLAICYVITFAIVSPIGIGCGILISHNNNNSTAAEIPSAILQGLATGTLLYVVFFEILSKERSGLKAYLAFVIGFAVMFGLQFASGHEHTHSHGGGGGHSHEHHSGEDEHHHDDGQNSAENLAEQIKLLRAVTFRQN